jgi:hypothetical protein
MLTTEEIEQLANEFEEEYPEELPQRYQWLVDHLGLSPRRVLRVMGLPPDRVRQLAEGPKVDWVAAIGDVGEWSAWYTHDVIVHLLEDFHYDWKGLREYLRHPLVREPELPLLGGKMLPISQLSPAEREEALLTLIAHAGPNARDALVTYLTQPESNPATS